MKDTRLTDKVILVTGAADGIGRECAVAYAREGARLALLDRDGAKVAALARELGPEHRAFTCDVGDGESVRAAVEATLAAFGRLDAIHNNAGIANPAKPLHTTSESEWDDLFRVNLKGVFNTTRHGYAALKASRGCILNTSSLVGSIGQADHAAYAATKGGLDALTKSMALDYAPDGVRVNAVCPAGVWTPMLRRWASEQADPAAVGRYLDAIHPLGACPEGDVIADAAVFLLSDAARFVTGHLLPVSGGAELGYRRI